MTTTGDEASAGSLRLQRLVIGYLDHLTVERGLSPNTIAAYRRDLTRYVVWLTKRGIHDVTEISTSDIEAYQMSLVAGDETHRPLATSSVARMIVAVRALHGFATSEGLASENVAIDVNPPNVGKRLPKALSVDEVQRLLDSIDRTEPIGLRDAALLEMLYGTGARITEITSLDVDDLTRIRDDPEAGLRLVGKGDKQRMVPLGSYARQAVDAWLVRGRPALVASAGRTSPALFVNTRGNRLSRQSAWGIIRDRAAQAGITTEVSPHSLRHSFATHLLDGGADVRVVQELLGHSSVTTTQIYTEVTVEHLREVYRSTHPRARG
ncbi:site-specific tyrosine recombinase XerD [Propionimicrobium sp. PCR01-08-3]|uniref:site-specific tyrosine recombinase XerD n=1 Tax=Propionimicrobium sp. PCR01-08-3 TaxID=3052086 RepID=UPI00255CD22F|nr:site-specific tyrosine recombinase XerD [Propionimicrobium sp. PCR01-08-3]WIY81840.1 site-specific tyrosine recombinase XerD [Propionimicrobium sp. PCR01-08-3]